ncbi:MAG: class I SAM-dependent methyltransferase [Mycobacterium sp.]
MLEFGVAHGYATNWWLNRLGQNVVWHGFDRFTGLPRAWKDFEKGAFSNDGEPPEITDPRVHWHPGDVEDTLNTVDISLHREGAQWMVLFDLDIYEPTAFAWGLIQEHIRPGDIIYFDEAGDDDERKVLDELVLPSIKCEPIAATPVGLGLVVR